MVALARAKEPTLIVSHQAILRMIYCYLTGKPREAAPSLDMNLNTVIKLTLTSTGCEEERFKLLDENGVDHDAPSH
jgi:broad specificity phosphatase PhoE